MTKSLILRTVLALTSLTVVAFPVVASAGTDARETTLQLSELASAQGDRDGHVRVFSGRDVLVFAVDGRAYVAGQAVSSGSRFELCKETRGGLDHCMPLGAAGGGDDTGYECKVDVADTVQHSCACSSTEDCLHMIKNGACDGHEMNCTENACTCDTEV